MLHVWRLYLRFECFAKWRVNSWGEGLLFRSKQRVYRIYFQNQWQGNWRTSKRRWCNPSVSNVQLNLLTEVSAEMLCRPHFDFPACVLYPNPKRMRGVLYTLPALLHQAGQRELKSRRELGTSLVWSQRVWIPQACSRDAPLHRTS